LPVASNQPANGIITTAMLRLAYKSMLVLLLTVAVAIGGCLPCQQLLGERKARSCCNTKGECQRPTSKAPISKACNLQLLQAQMEIQQYVGLVHTAAYDHGFASTVRPSPLHPASDQIDHFALDSSPPSLFLLHSSLLI